MWPNICPEILKGKWGFQTITFSIDQGKKLKGFNVHEPKPMLSH